MAARRLELALKLANGDKIAQDARALLDWELLKVSGHRDHSKLHRHSVVRLKEAAERAAGAIIKDPQLRKKRRRGKNPEMDHLIAFLVDLVLRAGGCAPSFNERTGHGTLKDLLEEMHPILPDHLRKFYSDKTIVRALATAIADYRALGLRPFEYRKLRAKCP